MYVLDRSGPVNAPTITSGPSGLVASTSASFAFSSSESGVAGYQCSLDGGAFAACTSPKSYSGLAQGARSFQVRAVDSLGNPGPSATRGLDGRHRRPGGAGVHADAARPVVDLDLALRLDG